MQSELVAGRLRPSSLHPIATVTAVGYEWDPVAGRLEHSPLKTFVAWAAQPVTPPGVTGHRKRCNVVPMERVAIVGPGGAGKSTFAIQLGESTGLPVVHLDRHFWKPGWVESSADEFRATQMELFAAERWIADGNYGGTFDERFGLADTVLVIARPRLACLAGALRRSLRNFRKPLQAEGPERIELSFLRWIWNYERESRPRLDAALRRNPHLNVIEFKTRRDMRHFLVTLGAT